MPSQREPLDAEALVARLQILLCCHLGLLGLCISCLSSLLLLLQQWTSLSQVAGSLYAGRPEAVGEATVLDLWSEIIRRLALHLHP